MSQLVARLLAPSEVHVTIPASPEEVYDVLADPETYPSWLAGAQRIRHVDPAFPAPGASFDHEVGPSEEVTVADDSVALRARRPERLDLEVHAGPMTGRVEFHLRPVADGTEVRMREELRGLLRAAMPLVRPFLDVRNRASLANLRDLGDSSSAQWAPKVT
jgi:uncharacterized protein YndB with AHSA1/START domain